MAENVKQIKTKVSKGAIITRDGWCCAYCGDFLTMDTATIDHVIPTSRGGPDELVNTVLSCLPCNAQKSDMGAALFNHYLAVRRYVFEIAPNEMITYGPILIETHGGFKTILALPALWAGVDRLHEEQRELWESKGVHVVRLAHHGMRHDAMIITGALYDYFNSRHFGSYKTT
jgi:hypothetical protein